MTNDVAHLQAAVRLFRLALVWYGVLAACLVLSDSTDGAVSTTARGVGLVAAILAAGYSGLAMWRSR